MRQLPMMNGFQQNSMMRGGFPQSPMMQGGLASQFMQPGMGSQSQMGMMDGMMQMMMQSMMQMMQGLMGMGQGGNALSSQPNFGAQGIGGGPSGGQGLNQFLGGSSGGGIGGGGGYGGSGGSSGQVGASTGTSSAAGASAELPEGVKGLTFAKAAELVKKGGGEVNPGGKPTVLALRTKTAASSTYQDTFVVLKKDGSLSPFSASTRPTSSGQDRAMLKPGAYEISPRWRDGKYNNDAFLVKSKSGSQNVGVGRDSNGDGQYSDQEMNANTSSSLIRLHRGGANTTSSTGCLNVKDYDGFLGAVGGKDASFNLVLVNLK